MFSNLKLGLKPHNPEHVERVAALAPKSQLEVADLLIASVPVDWALGRYWDPDPLDNDKIGICGPAAVVNWLKMMTAAKGRDSRAYTVEAAREAYHALGWDGTDKTDNGVVLLDLLTYWQQVGIGGVKLDAVFRVGFADAEHLATATVIAPLLVGATLTQACQTSTFWDKSIAADPTIWGGHCYLYHANSPGGGNGKSWGSAIFTTPDFGRQRWNEVYLPVVRDLMPNWINYDRLISLAKQL